MKNTFTVAALVSCASAFWGHGHLLGKYSDLISFWAIKPNSFDAIQHGSFV